MRGDFQKSDADGRKPNARQHCGSHAQYSRNAAYERSSQHKPQRGCSRHQPNEQFAIPLRVEPQLHERNGQPSGESGDSHADNHRQKRAYSIPLKRLA